NRVVWVNTVGLRLPHWGRRDLRKLLRKVRHWIGPKRAAGAIAAGSGPAADAAVAPEVRDLLLVPLPFGRPGRWLTSVILYRAARAWLRDASGKSFIISTLPLTADLVGAVPGATFVSYLVDDYGSWPGLGGRLVRQMDMEQARGADLIVAASQA